MKLPNFPTDSAYEFQTGRGELDYKQTEQRSPNSLAIGSIER